MGYGLETDHLKTRMETTKREKMYNILTQQYRIPPPPSPAPAPEKYKIEMHYRGNAYSRIALPASFLVAPTLPLAHRARPWSATRIGPLAQTVRDTTKNILN